MTPVGKAPRLDEPTDGVDDALRGGAVVCPQRFATTIVSSIDARDPLLDGPRTAPPRPAASLDGCGRAGATAATPLPRRVLSP